MQPRDDATITLLRRELALQVSRAISRLCITQIDASKRLNVPQPTLSKIINGQIDNLSVELLLRIAVRLGLTLTLHTSEIPKETEVFVSRARRFSPARRKSQLADFARKSLDASHRRLTPSQRLEAFVEHNQLLAELRLAGRVANRSRSGNERSTS